MGMILNKLFSTICILALAFTAVNAMAEEEVTGPEGPAIDLKAQSIRYGTDTSEFFANGHVRVDYNGMILTSDSIQGNWDTGDVVAQGNVEFQNGVNRLKAQTFKYNLRTAVGLATNASTKVGPIFFTAEELRADPGRYSLINSRFTGCDLQKPHYYMIARELAVEPGKRITAKHVTFVLLGNKLFTVPNYQVDLRKKNGRGQDFPMIGISRRYGVFVGKQFDVMQGTKTSGVLDARLSTKQVLQLGLSFDQINGRPYFVRTSYRLPYYGGSKAGLLVSRVPEFGVRLTCGDVSPKLSVTQDQLDLFSGYASVLTKPDHPGRLNSISELGFGEFLEDPTHTSGGRADARVLAWTSPVKVFDPHTSVSAGIMARQSLYSNGKEYTVLGYRCSIGRQFGNNTAAEVTYATRSPFGTSPFDFDQIDLANELDVRVYFPVGRYNLEVGERYNLRGRSFYDYDLSISRTYHCLTPKITWRKRFSEVGIGVGIVAF